MGQKGKKGGSGTKKPQILISRAAPPDGRQPKTKQYLMYLSNGYFDFFSKFGGREPFKIWHFSNSKSIFYVKHQLELSRQSCEIRNLLECKSKLALDKVNDSKGLKSCTILML